MVCQYEQWRRGAIRHLRRRAVPPNARSGLLIADWTVKRIDKAIPGRHRVGIRGSDWLGEYEMVTLLGAEETPGVQVRKEIQRLAPRLGRELTQIRRMPPRRVPPHLAAAATPPRCRGYARWWGCSSPEGTEGEIDKMEEEIVEVW